MRRPGLAALLAVVTMAVGACGGTEERGDADSVAAPASTVRVVPIAPPAPTTTSIAQPPTVPTPDVASDNTAPTTLAVPETEPVPAPPVVRSGATVSPDAPVGDPLSISIPSIGVESALVPAGVLDDGTVAVPPDPNIAGYFTGGPRPGERGPAVIMGHVDSKKSGPGVFWHLVDLAVGAPVTVQTTTGAEDFVVLSVEQYPKNEFPTERVYGPVPQPALRLITCGGSFDRSIRHYRDNIIAFLAPAATT